MTRLFFIAILLFSALAEAGGSKVPSSVKEWISKNAIVLKTSKAGQGFSDLEPLRKIIGNTRIVGMGEATHGTREFFELKHRVFEYLVEQLGFRIFAIEANFAESWQIDRYIRTGNGDPDKALASLYNWTWNTEEVLDLIRWMRIYNANPAHKKKIRFYGFDMQAPSAAVHVAIEYLKKNNFENAGQLKADLSDLINPFTARITLEFDQDAKTELLLKTSKLVAALDSLKSNSPEWHLARQHARVVHQFSEMLVALPEDFTVRDRLMAENVQWILEQEGVDAGILLWGHNFHVSKSPGPRRAPMGYHLNQMFPKQMIVFGFAFYQGSFQAVEMPFETGGGLRVFTVPSAPEGTFDAILAERGFSLAILPFLNLPAGEISDWFRLPLKTRSTGAAYEEGDPDEWFEEVILPDKFDAMIFVGTTSAARANPSSYRFFSKFFQSPQNLNFELGKEGEFPLSWDTQPASILGFDYNVTVSSPAPSGKQCVKISRSPGPRYGKYHAGVQQKLKAEAYAGKNICVRAAVRVDQKDEDDAAHLWVRVTPTGFAKATTRYIAIQESDWNYYNIRGVVSSSSASVEYGLVFSGEGTAWVDDFSVRVCE